METKHNVLTYPEEYMVYREVEAEEISFNLPYYFAKKIKDISEELGAKVYVGVWWPYAYITLIRELEKEIERCVENYMSENSKENRQYCKGECGKDQKCIEECIHEIRAASYYACRDELVDELRPAFLDKARELEKEAELYGIAMQTGVYADNEGLKLKIRLEGYSNIIPLNLGKALFYQMLDVALTKHFTNAEKFSREIVGFLIRFYKIEELETLAKTIDKSKIYISQIYEDCCSVRKYEITMEYNNNKIRFIITEEKKDDRWIITNITGISAVSPIADLTPA